MPHSLCNRCRFKAASLALGVMLMGVESVVALPAPEDKPEEVLRAEIITGARSPIDGKPLTAAEYAALQAELAAAPPEEIKLSPQVRRNIRLLKLRKFLKTILPFLPI